MNIEFWTFWEKPYHPHAIFELSLQSPKTYMYEYRILDSLPDATQCLKFGPKNRIFVYIPNILNPKK